VAENSYISSSEKEKSGMPLFIFKAVLFIAMLVPVVIFIGHKYSAASTENQINTYNQCRWDEFYSLPENSIDMVYLGSSHSYCTFDPDIVDGELGTNSYQLGMPLQHMDSTYYTMREVLNYQKPKLAVVEVYWDMMDDEFELTQAGYLFQVMKNKELEQDYIKEVFPLSEKIKYNNAALRYQADYFAYRTSELKKSLEAKYNVALPATQKQVGTEKYRSKGYTYCDYNMLPDEFDKTNQFKGLDGSEWSIDATQVKYLEKLTELCRDNGVEVVFVTAPIANVSMDFIQNYDDIHNTVQAIADRLEVKYLDFNYVNRDNNLLTNDNFRDDAHLNHSGVEIVDKYFAAWLKGNYEVGDMLG
jgi:hypothetical protein